MNPPDEKPPVRRAHSSSLRLPGAGLPGAGSGPLPPEPPPPAPLAEAPTAPQGSEDPAAASRRRMAFIVAYMKDPTSDPAFTDRPLVYRILTEERDHQQLQIAQLQDQQRRLPPGDDPAVVERRAELEARLKQLQTRQQQLFAQLKKVTGVKGTTGGTGFLKAADLPLGPPIPGPKPPAE